MKPTKAKYRRITLKLSAKLLAQIEETVEATYCTRSDYIRSAIVLRLQQQQQLPAKMPSPEPSQPPLTTWEAEDSYLADLAKQYAGTDDEENC